MGSGSFHALPLEDNELKALGKTSKPSHLTSVRAKNASTALHRDAVAGAALIRGRRKRVWKACERCRLKQSKVRSSSSLYPNLARIYTNNVSYSVMVNFLVNAARMMESAAPPVSKRRGSTSSCPEGISYHISHYFSID